MQTFERRIAALEQANPPAQELTIIRRIVVPGHLDAQVCRLRADNGQLWTRQPGETEQGLIERASQEVSRPEWGAARLVTAD
jgi:hypothetical protein